MGVMGGVFLSSVVTRVAVEIIEALVSRDECNKAKSIVEEDKKLSDELKDAEKVHVYFSIPN